MLNNSLITPDEIIDKAFTLQQKMNSLKLYPKASFGKFIEGDEIITWNLHKLKEVLKRNQEFLWGFKRKIPKSILRGTTGIEPYNEYPLKVFLKTGYMHQ